jgi:hypothetical protein
MNEIRNQYGFPVMEKREWAQQYAAEARIRNEPECQCGPCVRERLLPVIQNMTAAQARRIA